MTHKTVVYKYGTGNPVEPNGSGDVRDGIDNLQSFDVFMNAYEDTYNQRDGDVVKTVSGMENVFDSMILGMNSEFDSHIINMGFTRVGTFAAGGTLTNPRQTLLWETSAGGDGQEYGWSGIFPKVVPPASTPTSTGGIAIGAWVSRFDPELRIQIRENANRIYADAGLNLAAGSFEAGAVAAEATDVVLLESSGKAYAYINTFPGGGITVPPGSTPDSNWVEVSPRYKASVTPEMFGADGADDTTIIKRARNFLIAMGGGTLTLTRVYTVGKQVANPSPSTSVPYWQSVDADMLTFTGLNGVNVYFDQGAELKFANGLRYGSFDPLTGAVHNAPAGGFTNPAYAASPGNVINFLSCINSTVRHPKINGNMDNIIKGGYWGDVGIQLQSIGIRSGNSVNTTVFNPDIKDMPLDGLYASGSASQWINFVVHGGVIDRCGRQGFSWTGGDGVFFYGTILRHAGMGPISSKPQSNIDIEDNGVGCKFGRFYDIKSYNALGTSVLTLNTTDDIKFYNCDIAGDPSGGRALWAASNGVEFHSCKIYGSLINCASNEFFDCYFTNKLYVGDGVGDQLFLDINSPVTIHRGVIDNYHPSLYGFNIRGGCKVIGTKFLFSATDPLKRSKVGIVDCHLQDVKFEQKYTFVNTPPTDIELFGEYTFVEYGSNYTFEGKTTISGSGLAWGSREGSINSIVNPLKQSTYTDEIVFTCSGVGPTFIIPMPRTGTYMVNLSKTTGNSTLRTTRAMWLVCSIQSGSAANHSFAKVASINNALGTGGSVEMGLNAGADAIILTQGSIPLDTEKWIVRISSLDTKMMPI